MLPFQKNVISKLRRGDSKDPYVSIEESQQIVNGKAVLSEIPDDFNRVFVTGENITWLETKGSIKQTNQYQVDYNSNVVTFHPSHNGKSLTFKYKGKGGHYISTNMIFTDEESGNVIQTLDEVISDAENTLQTTIDKQKEITQGEATRQSNESTRQTQESKRQTDSQKAIENINKAADSIKNVWKPYINSFSEINTALPLPF
ncbi:hypothetical protein EVU96_09440 [Bacillus infantis]|uniref:hypothetical protein n=1 Tax=Bacillus infantis TaxID=324767 RepID=UPI00101DFC0C|nr:hypothetical protein [Bacillus infantis]RYI30629.1 hypothetical protein EVU96_09440 [Bacillus infantis]